MKLFTRTTLALVLLALAVVLWLAGGQELRLADAERALVTFRYEQAAGLLARLDEGLLARAARRLRSRPAGVASARAAASYWGAADGTPDAGQDPFVAANQAYRAAVQPGGDWQTVVSRLDRVIEQYADVLRSHPGHPDAAYNYEFVVRYRAAVAARRQNVPPAGTDEPPSSMHGLEGAPPPEGGGKQFRMLVPMLPDERREAEEAARGGRRIRKG